MQEVYESRERNLESILKWYQEQGYKEAIEYDQELIMKQNTALSRYSYHLRIKEALEFINKPIAKITPEDIKNYQVKIARLKANTVRAKLHPLRKLFKFLIENSKNKQRKQYQEVYQVIKLPPSELNPPKDVLTDEEIERIISAANSARDKALIAILANTGARVAEICSLKFKNIITIDQDLAIKFEGRTHTKLHEKTIILTYARKYLELYLNSISYTGPESYIFESYEGKPLHPSRVNQILKEIENKLKLGKRLTPHLFRHSRGTKLSRMPITPIQAMQFMGWKKMDMWKIYAHPTPTETAKAIASLEGGKPAEIKQEQVDFNTNVEKLAIKAAEEKARLERQVKEMQDTIAAFKDAIEILRSYYGEDMLLLDPKTFKVVKVARRVLPPIDIKLEK
jgi:integrase